MLLCMLCTYLGILLQASSVSRILAGHTQAEADKEHSVPFPIGSGDAPASMKKRNGNFVDANKGIPRTGCAISEHARSHVDAGAAVEAHIAHGGDVALPHHLQGQQQPGRQGGKRE